MAGSRSAHLRPSGDREAVSIRGDRLREAQWETERRNAQEMLDRINAILEHEENDLEASRFEVRHNGYCPDDHDDRWADEWDRDFAESEREYRRHMRYE